MKAYCKPLATSLVAPFALITIHFSLLTLAAVPLAWEVRPGQPAPVMFDRYHGETLSFAATFRGFGELPFSPDADIRLWYQTNGMGQAWWSVPATVSSNVLSATWSPALDPGADRVSLFFGAPSNAFASAVLRLRPSPGFFPNVLNPPPTLVDLESGLAAFCSTGTAFRAATIGTETRWIDVTGCVWEVSTGDWVMSPTNYTGDSEWWAGKPIYLVETHTPGEWWRPMCEGDYIGIGKGDEESISLAWGSEESYIDITATRSLYCTNLAGRVAYTNDIPAETDPTVPEWAKEPNPPTYSAADVGAAPASLVQAVTNIQVESALGYRLYSGSNVVAEVTNYNSQVHAPELRLMQLNESNEYITVWTETNGLARTLASATAYTDDATNALQEVYAPRAWSRTTSGLGAEAPSNTTWISTPTTVIAGGFEYAKFVDTYGEVWVLTSNGMAAEFNPDTNAYFRITADDGTPVFSIEKSDAQLVGANAAGITVGETTITIPVPVVSSVAPTMYWRASLSSGDWADELSPPTGATVTWSGTAGSWVCTVSFTGTRPSSMFFKFNFLQEGGVVIRNNATTDLSSGIWVNGTKYVPVANGSTLTWQAQ